MDHVVYLDARAKEMDNLLLGKKSMVFRGAMGRKVPYGRIDVGDTLYFINNNAEGLIKAKGDVSFVFNSEKMSKDESIALLNKNQDKLQLTDKQFQRWGGKRYIVLVEVSDIEEIKPFVFDKTKHHTMDDWLIVENIETINS
jgi:hypothetical protein